MANPFFDAAYYLAKNPDVAAAGYTLANAEQHYIKYGAAESVDDPNRAPNAWFDAKAYLAAYPDLAAAGVTAATAFQHYIAYGINENRSPAANVNPADFTYALYAASNPDLLAAFGIGDPAHLTMLQQHQLLAHFLEYGIHEHRPGVASPTSGSFFAAPTSAPTSAPPAVPMNIAVDGSAADHIYSGGDADDTFTGNDANVDGSILKGYGGNDTLKLTWLTGHAISATLDSVENIVATSIDNATLDVGTTALHSVSVDLGALSSFSLSSGKVDAVSLQGIGTVSVQQRGVSGSADTMTLATGNGTTNTFTANGVETYQVTTGTGSSHLSLHANAVDGNTLTVSVTGGETGQPSSFTLFGTSSGGLQTAMLDASGVASNQTLAVDSSLAGVNSTVKGGSGNNTLTGVADASHTSTLIGGTGTDTVNASVGQDIMTGGTGATNTFVFGAGTARPYLDGNGVITQMDTITDYKAGDVLSFGDLTFGAGATIISRSNQGVGAMSFTSTVLSLANANAASLFTYDHNLYFLVPGSASGDLTGAHLIKLAGFDVNIADYSLNVSTHGFYLSPQP